MMPENFPWVDITPRWVQPQVYAGFILLASDTAHII
jgi:hypothetical protein